MLSLGARTVFSSNREEAYGGAGNDLILVNVGAADVDGGRGVDEVDFSGETDLLANGGFVRGVTVDLAAGAYTANVVTGAAVWADTGTTEDRGQDTEWEGPYARLSPTVALRANPFYEREHNDKTIVLPDPEDPDSPDVRVVAKQFESVVEGTLKNIETVKGTVSGDQISGNNAANTLKGYHGDDTLRGSGGADTLFGGNGRDLVYGGDGNDRLSGGAWADTLNGWEGNDVVAGGTQADVLRGGSGNDTVFGGSGKDTFFDTATDVPSGNDRYVGGTGRDTFVFGTDAGKDTITDYQPRLDVIRLPGAPDRFDDLDIRRDGDTVVIRHEDTVIVLEDTRLDQLRADQFELI